MATNTNAVTTAVSEDTSWISDTARCACCEKDAEGKRCNRTPEQWHQLLFFYFCFYSSLIAFFAICYAVMYETLPDRQSEPVFQNLIKNSLVEYPYEPDYNAADGEAVGDALREVTDMLQRSGRSIDPLPDFGPCLGANNYGLATTSPCLFFRLNRKFGFKPPQDATFSCLPGDRAPGGITFAYSTPQSFPASEYPFMNGADGQPSNPYVDPIVAVQINGLSPATEYDFEINCQANWGQEQGDSECGYREARIQIRTP